MQCIISCVVQGFVPRPVARALARIYTLIYLLLGSSLLDSIQVGAITLEWSAREANFCSDGPEGKKLDDTVDCECFVL